MAKLCREGKGREGKGRVLAGERTKGEGKMKVRKESGMLGLYSQLRLCC